MVDETGEALARRVKRAVTPWERMRGLLGRNGLEPGEGLLIERCFSIHMFFMRFAIDVVFLDRDWRVVKKVADLAPWRMAWCWGAAHTLELAAGALGSVEVPLGCHVTLCEDR